MYQRTLLGSKVLRPFANPSPGSSRWRVYLPNKPSTLHVFKIPSQIPVARQFSSNQVMLKTTTGNVIPSTGNSRLDAKVQGGYRNIREDMTCADFHDSVWGFVIYRIVEGSDDAWNGILQQLKSHIQQDLEAQQCQDILPFHDLHVIDDKSLYGASIDEVRAHFQAWAPRNLEARLRPDTKCTISDVGHLSVDVTPRYKYCLVVDEICLESVGHPEGLGPVVKLVCRDWESPWGPEEKLEGLHPMFHEGIIYYEEGEDVGWMYMPLLFYMDKYKSFHDWSWDELYVRPPFIDGAEDETNMVGYWRRKKDVNLEKEGSNT